MRDKLVIGTNTKMYMTAARTTEYLRELGRLTEGLDRATLELFIIPSFTSISAAAETGKKVGIRLGAQNMAWEDEGQYTGEVSAPMLREAGAQIVEIGHSERRHLFGETDDMVNRKVLAALRHNFTPLLCVGETAQQKHLGIADETLRIQLKTALYGITAQQASCLWIAYEPVWAIGTAGKPASEFYASSKHVVIRDTLSELFGPAVSREIPLLYGGSVNAENAPGLIEMPHIDGLFIGRSAWDAANFSRIIHAVLPVFIGKAHNMRALAE